MRVLGHRNLKVVPAHLGEQFVKEDGNRLHLTRPFHNRHDLGHSRRDPSRTVEMQSLNAEQVACREKLLVDDLALSLIHRPDACLPVHPLHHAQFIGIESAD